MGFLKRLFGFGPKKEVPKVADEKPTDLQNCPFCWGYQEFGSQRRAISEDKQINVKNHRDKNVKLGKFMVEHVDGFKNKKRIMERCPECGGKRIRYKKNS